MVKLGVCDAGAMYPDLNRYCNIVPFESHRVKLSIDAASSWAKDHPFEAREALDPYINATLLAFPPALDSHRYIMSMGPMHPDYHGSVYCTHTDPAVVHSAVQCIGWDAPVSSGFGCGGAWCGHFTGLYTRYAAPFVLALLLLFDCVC